MYEEDDVEVEYVPEQFDASDPNYRAFAKIFEAFKVSGVSFFKRVSKKITIGFNGPRKYSNTKKTF